MSFKSTGPKTRPERVKPAPVQPTDTTPLPPSWSQHSSRRRSSSSSSSIASFHSARFPPDEESRMLASSHDLKSQANTQFSKQDYTSAISTYDRALAELPSYLDYEMAVLQSNIAACHLKLEQWKEAIDSCEKGLEGLEREMPTKPKQKAQARTQKTKKSKNSDKDKPKDKDATNGTQRPSRGRLNSDTESDSSSSSPVISPEKDDQEDEDDKVVELPPDADEAASTLAALQLSDARKSDIHRIRTKLLLRRGRARSCLDPQTWSNLSAALEDYKTLQQTPEYFNALPPSDQKTVRQALVSLPPKVSAAKDREVADMMGKLKNLGNGILKPFGLSTENFKVVQGEGGGYSLSFDGGGGGAGGKKA
ncbi:hypothetical protein LTR40_008614 [Exophiala xenobiotica]|nr:hypothetical protein LTR40_008614 [Exophiala xenobiotica]